MARQATQRSRAQMEHEALIALNLHTTGLSTRQIAQKMTDDGIAIGQSTVTRRIQLALELYVVPGLEDARKTELARLDTYLEYLADKVIDGDVAAIKTAVSIQERRARMLGLDAPTKSEVKNETPAPAIVGMISDAQNRLRAVPSG